MSQEAWFFFVWWVGMVVCFVGIADALSDLLEHLAAKVMGDDE